MSLFVPPSGTIHPLWLMHYRERLRNVCHSIGEINIILFLIHSSGVDIKGVKVLHSLIRLYCQGQGDMGEERHW